MKILQSARLDLSDIAVALFVIAITAMLLIPLPTALLDLLLVINISSSLLLLLVGLYMPNALALLAFPTLLLLSTLFRLSLNVASTRLILLQGDAGTVIQAFGTFLIRGEVVVGVIIFTIITVVNFIVIAKGSARVSEVAARFALDSLPGKQMAIDSDLRSGLISPAEAEQKREELRKESQLFGSMDGAMKFVQGDAVAGFFIIFWNILGGLYQGIASGLSVPEAVETYTTLTVGDGLVSQIPALLVSICAGIVVTRVSSNDGATLGRDVSNQMFQRPGTVLFSGTLLIFMGLLPGLPFAPFAVIGVILCAFGLYLLRADRLGGIIARGFGADVTQPRALLDSPTRARKQSLPYEQRPIQVVMDSAILHRLYLQQAESRQLWWKEFQADFYQEVGLALPELEISADPMIEGESFRIFIKGIKVAEGRVPLDCLFLGLHQQVARLFGFEPVRQQAHPLTGGMGVWVLNSAAAKAICQASSIVGYDFFGFISLVIARKALEHPEELLTMSDVLLRMREIEKAHPGLLSEGFNSEFLNISRLSHVLQELVRQDVNIRDFKSVLEELAGYCTSYGSSLVQEDDFDLEDIVSYMRMKRGRQILSKYLGSQDSLRVITLSDEIESLFQSSTTSQIGARGAQPRSDLERLQRSLRSQLEPLFNKGLVPVVILCGQDVRQRVNKFLRSIQVSLPVFAHQEIDPLVQLEHVARWNLAE